MINLVGLYGDSRSGKDTVASFLVQDFGFEQRNMADKIREILLHMNLDLVNKNGESFGSLWTYVHENGWDDTKANFPQTVDWMIGLGQAARDVIDINVWLTTVLQNRPEKLVIADVRQLNEYVMIKALGGQVWKITRPDTTPRGMDRLLENCEFQVYIDNNGTLLDLKYTVQEIITSQFEPTNLKNLS